MSQIDAIIADLDNFSERQLIRLALEVNANCIVATPVDIGWARAGWVASTGRPHQLGADLSPDPSDVTIALGRQSAGNAEVVGYRLAQGNLFSTNNVTYIEVLNSGSSSQAPAAFVQSAIAKAVRTVQ
jgi:hypothetical protein